MVKRVLSALLCICLGFALCITAFAATGFPLSTIKAPEKLGFVFTYPNDGDECIEAVYFVPDDLAAVLSMSTEDQQATYGSAFQGCVQFDWSVDSKDSFHYDDSWDTIETTAPMQKLGGSFLEQSELFWFTYDEDAKRCAPGVATKTKTVEIEPEDEFNFGFTVDDYDPTAPQTKEISYKVFDFAKHKLYVRARFFVYDFDKKTCHFSKWSTVTEVTQNATASKIENEVSRPTVTNARLSDDGRYLFDIAFDQSIKDAAYKLRMGYGTDMNLEAQVRVAGDSWVNWMISDSLNPYLVGTKSFSADPNGQKIEFRCRLTGGNADDGTFVETGWSDILSDDNGNISIATNDDPYDEVAKKAEADAAAKAAKRCKVCGICPIHPLDICMFVWIGLIVVIAGIVVYVVISRKKKAAKAAETKKREEASRKEDADLTASIFNTDQIKPVSSKEKDKEEKKDENKEESEDETKDEEKKDEEE